ncbi:sensor histidine kinase [Polluticoccus soli]|uniref:sensor histidine kinase n=1 Tax=Polluticoccus soli TaxID=3034150 RepID=UPI0023E30964|nr:ATP-binding protein [Flavipsychrobacter sp. JY13-12]
MFDSDIGFTIVVTTLLILLLIAGVIITIFLANRRHVQQEVKMALMQTNYEKELRAVENEVQEQTLNNISRELHDNIGHLLTLMRIQIEQEKLDRPEVVTTLAPIDSTLTDTIQQVRLLSHSLNSDVLEQKGLLQMVEQEANRLRQFKKISIHLQHDETEPVLNKDQRIMAFRIYQELLNNMLKHARAKNIHVQLKAKDKFTLLLSDDGQGFDLAETMRSGGGAGLKNMTKRAALANLHFHIDTAVGKGSTFTLSETNI